MPFKTFTAGVLTSSEVNTYLMQQAIIVCTSTTRPSLPTEGMTIYETDTDTYRTYSGSAWEVMLKSGAWITYTPTIGNAGGGTNWALGNGTAAGAYQQIGRLTIGWAQVTWGSTSTFGTNDLLISGPLTSSTRAGIEWTVAQVHCRDVSTVNAYDGYGWMSSATTSIVPGVFATSDGRGNFATNESIINTRPFTWASGDYLTLQFTYEAAS
jgi:hypothetical protein